MYILPPLSYCIRNTKDQKSTAWFSVQTCLVGIDRIKDAASEADNVLIPISTCLLDQRCRGIHDVLVLVLV